MGLYEFHGDTKPTTGYLKFMKMWLEDKFISKSENIKIRFFCIRIPLNYFDCLKPRVCEFFSCSVENKIDSIFSVNIRKCLSTQTMG